MKNLLSILVTLFLLSSCVNTSTLTQNDTDEFEIADKLNAPLTLAPGFAEYKNSILSFVHPEWYTDGIEVKSYTFKDFVGNTCVREEIEEWVEQNPSAVQDDIIAFWEERHDYYKEVLHSIKGWFYEQSLNENGKHFDYRDCGKGIRLIGWKNVIIGWIQGLLLQYVDVKRNEPICSSNFTTELILVKSVNEIITLKLWENTSISWEWLTKNAEWNLCATFDDVDSARALLDKIMAYFGTGESLQNSPFAFLEQRDEELNDILMNIKINTDYINTPSRPENKDYIPRITKKYINSALEKPKEFSYEIPNISGKTILEVETIYRAGELSYKVFYTGDNTYMEEHQNDTITLKFKDDNDFMLAKQFITLSDFVPGITRQGQTNSYLWIEWSIETNQEKYISISGVSFTFPQVEKSNIESDILVNLETSRLDEFTKESFEIIPKSGWENMKITSIDSFDDYNRQALILGEVMNPSVTKISVDFSNAWSDYPDDHYILQKFKQWNTTFEYKAFSEYDVFDSWENRYTITAFAWADIVAVVDVVIHSN